MEKIHVNKEKIIISVHQPGYHRYLGYFYKIWLSDIFISFDTVQYVPREYQNRQRFLFDGKLKWLTVPTDSGRDPIYKKKIVFDEVIRNHWKIIEEIYKHSAYFNLYRYEMSEFYHRDWVYLSDFCDQFSLLIMRLIGINTIFIKASDYYKNKGNYKKAALIVNTIERTINVDDYKEVIYTPRAYPIPVDHYLYTKPAGKDYLEIDIFKKANISVNPYLFSFPSYTQSFRERENFIPNLSIIDLLFNEGPNSLSIIRSCGKPNSKGL